MIRLEFSKREWVSQWVSDKHSQWSDSGPVKICYLPFRRHLHFSTHVCNLQCCLLGPLPLCNKVIWFTSFDIGQLGSLIFCISLTPESILQVQPSSWRIMENTCITSCWKWACLKSEIGALSQANWASGKVKENVILWTLDKLDSPRKVLILRVVTHWEWKSAKSLQNKLW